MQIWPHKHIHTLANFSIKDYESVFELANRFDALKNAGTKKIPALQGTLVTSLFFEPSTRTKNSFELAAKRLSADVQTFAPSSSSLTKGETIIDTAITYSAMGADTLVIRHSSSYITFEIAEKLDAINSKTSILNAGDGLHSHPSQGLLDIYTLIKFFSKESLSPEILNSKKILIIGALGIAVAIAVFFVSYKKYFNSPLNKELAEKKKALIKEQKELNERLEKIEQDLKNL